MDAGEFVAAVTGRAGPQAAATAAAAEQVTPQDPERRQACGGICCSAACCCWRPKQSSRIAYRRCKLPDRHGTHCRYERVRAHWKTAGELERSVDDDLTNSEAGMGDGTPCGARRGHPADPEPLAPEARAARRGRRGRRHACWRCCSRRPASKRFGSARPRSSRSASSSWSRVRRAGCCLARGGR